MTDREVAATLGLLGAAMNAWIDARAGQLRMEILLRVERAKRRVLGGLGRV